MSGETSKNTMNTALPFQRSNILPCYEFRFASSRETLSKNKILQKFEESDIGAAFIQTFPPIIFGRTPDCPHPTGSRLVLSSRQLQ